MEREDSQFSSHLRRPLLELLIFSSQQLLVRPIVKYTALSLFSDRFVPSIFRSRETNLFDERCEGKCWLLHPLRESNLQLFALVSIWVSSKVSLTCMFPSPHSCVLLLFDDRRFLFALELHDTRPLSVKSLKSLGDMLITDQCFTTRDFAEAEMVFLEVLEFNIGASKVTFIFLEELLIQFRELSKLGELVSLELCMDITDLLYETGQTSILFSEPQALAASILVLP